MKKYTQLRNLNRDFNSLFVELADNRIFLSRSLSRYIDRELTRHYKRAYRALQCLEREKERAISCQRRQERLQAFLLRLRNRFVEREFAKLFKSDYETLRHFEKEELRLEREKELAARIEALKTSLDVSKVKNTNKEPPSLEEGTNE